jgi:hypothetical protein
MSLINGTPTPATSAQDDNSTAESSEKERLSHQTIYTSPPPVKEPYNPAEALEDLPGISYALELFLASKMVESEDYCNKSDETK